MVKNKLFAILLCVTMLLFSVVTAVPVSAAEAYTVAQVQSLCDGIVAYNGYASAQAFIDGSLCANAGATAEFYAIALSQSGDYRFSGYESALLSYLDTHEVRSAASREKYALALAAAGSTDRYISDTANEAIGGLGVMSLVFGMHLLNNGYDSRLYTTDELLGEILSREKENGGWAVSGSWGDVDVTAMTLQALAPHYGGRSDVTAAVDRAVRWLSQKQLDSGGYKTMGIENCESAAQVIMALSALGIDAQGDSRFVKNGTSVMAAMTRYRLQNGGFSHTGGDGNDTATVEAFCALVSYCRMKNGQKSFYQLDHAVRRASSDSRADREDTDGGAEQDGGSRQSDSRSSGGSVNRSFDRSDSAGGSDQDAPAREDDADSDSGNRVFYVNGKRYIEATDASGERVTVGIDETQAQRPAAATQAPAYGGFQPGATDDTAARDASIDESGGRGGYKPYAILAIVLAAGGGCAVLFLMKKRNKKHYIAVGIVAAAGVIFVLLTNFESTEAHYHPQENKGEFTVTLSIRCDTIKDREKKHELIPDDGVILDTKTFSASSGDTVYDVLQNAAKTYRIQIDNSGADGAAYIAGLGGLYEFDYGDLSGWMYRVNGTFPEVGCQSCTVHDGDRIEWLYTTDIGKDL